MSQLIFSKNKIIARKIKYDVILVHGDVSTTFVTAIVYLYLEFITFIFQILKILIGKRL